MKYAIRYYSRNLFISSADEIILRFIDKHDELAEYIKTYYSYQRIILDVSGYDEAETGKELIEYLPMIAEAALEHEQFAVMLSYKQINFAKELDENGIAYFFNMRVDTIDKLNSLLSLNLEIIYNT